MTESIKKYILLGVLISGLSLVLYAMPEQQVFSEDVNAGMQLSGHFNK